MLSQLVYVSNRNANCTDEEIDKILQSCQRNNANRDITGVLLYSDKHFVQYLEGNYSEIIDLYDRIKTDNRHQKTILITSAPIKERTFPSWQMGAKKIDNESVTFKTSITEEDRLTFNEILSGKNQEDNKALHIMKKFFR
ncbi:BLUF domain-containing protein [Chryseosolibacter indicus]|uniref:BLUF domain-containing protein n=1 Tax=Chryseosolibacter indicus TaxID=2782351 RepID=A0ABS5VN93_9BACT|nr:BLUF domain-containing protein [Chryseosolibacter indicus]MBT1702909.1 BLUF domain-containing protein [Chryseosolibacter indicus]